MSSARNYTGAKELHMGLHFLFPSVYKDHEMNVCSL